MATSKGKKCIFLCVTGHASSTPLEKSTKSNHLERVSRTIVLQAKFTITFIWFICEVVHTRTKVVLKWLQTQEKITH